MSAPSAVLAPPAAPARRIFTDRINRIEVSAVAIAYASLNSTTNP